MRNLTTGFVSLLAIGATALAVAQTAPPPSGSDPSSASSPSQRDATKSTAPESAPTSSTDPSAASTPSQHEATAGGSQKQMMKDCMAKEKANNADASKDQIKKTCTAQMKANPSG
jgi:hypothetical protein